MNWDLKSWSEVLEIKNGKNQRKVVDKNGIYPIYGSGGIMGYANDYLCEAGTTIIGRKGSINNPIFVNERFWNVDTAFGLVPKKGLDNRYFYYFCSTYNFLKHNKATTLPSLTKTDLLKIQIPLPPLPIQQKIAAVLDKADAIRKRSQQILAKYDQLAQSVFLEMFGDPVKNEKGWDSISLDKICGVGSSKRVFVDELVNKGIPFYRGTEIGKLGEGQEITPSLFITEKHYNDLRDYSGIPQIGDLLMPSICPDGRIWRVNDNRSFYFKDGRVLWIKVNPENINSIYLHAFLRNIFQQNYSNIASGTTFAELKIFALKKIEVLIPSNNLQNQFASIITQIEKQKAQTQLELDRAEALYQSLLQRAFTGELFPEKELTEA